MTGVEPGLNVIVSLTFRVLRRTFLTSNPARTQRLKTFHATMAVTRLEEWCVDANTPEEAKALIAAGQGHRCHLGDCVHVELQQIEDGN